MSDCSIVIKSQPTITVIKSQPTNSVIKVQAINPTIESHPTITVVRKLDLDCRITTIGIQGPTGVQGPSNSFSGTAGASILAYTAIVLISGLLYPADPTNLAHSGVVVGIAGNSASIGNPVNVIVSGEATAGVFPANSRLYVGLAGVLSTSPAAIGAVWQKSIGITKNVTTLVLSIQPSIII